MIDVSVYKGKNVAVFGLGKAGASTVHALLRGGAKVFASDDNVAACEALQRQALPNLTVADPKTYAWREIVALILSPGIPLTHPDPHPVVVMARDATVPIVCDIELLFRQQPNAAYIGITGTNGKSTTTALTGHILKTCGKKVEVGGNIGIPALDLAPLEKDGYYVIELSSYQLDLMDTLRVKVGALLNITPDHLERHGGMTGYIAAKCRMFEHQGKGDVAVVNVDDDPSLSVFYRLHEQARISEVLPVSVHKKVVGGVAVVDGELINDIDHNGDVYRLGELKRLPGRHNAQNIAVAFAITYSLGLQAKDIIEAIETFEGLRHRMQLVAEKGGVRFVNDSKGTNADATSHALSAVDDIYWIAGGRAKEGGIESLAQFFPKVTHAYLIGEAQQMFAKTLEGKAVAEKCDTLEKAFQKASHDALKAGKGVVLLSPACASFDQWPSFEVRGDAFCTMVQNLVNTHKQQV